MPKKKQLRSGYTTGACAAAAAKAAVMLLLKQKPGNNEVEIPFPDGSRHKFKISKSKISTRKSQTLSIASVIKDAGDDPDVTNGAEISATARQMGDSPDSTASPVNTGQPPISIVIKGGKGVGIVTKPGLAIPVGEPAINPVPRRMIKEAVIEAISDFKSQISNLEITISVTNGEELAKKTLNPRLGIIGGISILGTTGIVKPLSTEAWTASITAAMDVAKAAGNTEVVLSAGRQSEKAHMKKFDLPQEAYVMMGDYLEFSLLDAVKHSFKKIHLCAQWAKMLKIAMSTPQTHVRHGALDVRRAAEFLNAVGIAVPKNREFNTAREIYDFINSSAISRQPSAFLDVCRAAKEYAESLTSGIPVAVYLVSYEGDIIINSG
jgi:cobalt-precorrin-5B (C1)-methyltransferase